MSVFLTAAHAMHIIAASRQYRHHSNEYGDIENYISKKFADVSDTVFIDVNAIRSTTVTRYEQKDEDYGCYDDNILIEEMAESCLGGGTYMWEDGKLKEW